MALEMLVYIVGFMNLMRVTDNFSEKKRMHPA